MKKRIFALVLCLVFLLVVFVACDKDPTPADKETTTTVESTEAESTEAETTEPEETEPEETEPEETEPEETEPEETEPEETEPEETEPEETEPEEPVPTEALKDYTIVYPKRASETVKQAALSLQAKINELVGGSGIAAIADSDIPVTDKEILVGKTSRPASKAQYKDGAKAEFLLCNVDEALVLTGHNDALTAKAVQYFEENYLSDAKDGKIFPVEDYTETVTTGFRLTTANASKVTVTYSEGWETVANSIIQKVKSKTGIALTKKLADSSYTYSKTATEIMVGQFTQAEPSVIANCLWDNGYAVGVNGSKLVVTAKTTDKTNQDGAVALFEEMLADYLLYEDYSVCFLDGASAHKGGKEVLSNIPGISVAPSVVYPAGDGAYVALFRDVKTTVFNEYLKALPKAGFSQYTRTNFHGDKDTTKNYFATYVSDTNSVDIGYHTKGYLGTPDVFEAAYSKGIMFVTVSPRDGLTLPLQKAPEYTPVDAEQYPTVVTQVGLGDYHAGEAANCYVIRLADGTLIVHDSGYSKSTATADAIYNVLRTLAPDENNIVITAWITSHPHGDHMYGLEAFAPKYASYPNLTVKQFVHNFADITIAAAFENECAAAVRNAMKMFGSNVTYVKPHAGNVLYYANVKFNVLYTQENHLQVNGGTRYDGNASTMVMQMVTDDGVKVMFGGDSPQDNHYTGSLEDPNTGSDTRKPFTYNALAKRYGTFAESDVMTYFHHGLGGGSSWDSNAAIKPKIVLWPITWGKIESALSGGTNLLDSGHSRYVTRLTADSEGGSFEEGYLHDTPNYNGVYGWFIADNDVHVVNLDEKNSNGIPTVTTYETLNDFYNGNPAA